MSLPANPPEVWARQALTRRVLETFAQAMGEAGVNVLAVKGVVTSRWLYADVAERPLTDLDVRVRPEDLGAVLRESARRGWRVDRHLWSYRNAVVEILGVPVDIETFIGPPGTSRTSVADLFARAKKDAAGFWTPDPHDHAVLLTINVFKDKLSLAMPWARDDVARVVDAPGFDIAVFVERAREARVAGLAWVVADWMGREGKHQTWADIRARLDNDARSRRVYTSLMKRLLLTQDPASLQVRLATRAASDDPRRWPLAFALALTAEMELAFLRRRH